MHEAKIYFRSLISSVQMSAAASTSAYLRKRGIKQQQQPTSNEDAMDVGQFVLDSTLLDVDSTVVENILSFYNPAEANQPQLIEESYKRLKAWVDDSLDLYKVRVVTFILAVTSLILRVAGTANRALSALCSRVFGPHWTRIHCGSSPFL